MALVHITGGRVVHPARAADGGCVDAAAYHAGATIAHNTAHITFALDIAAVGAVQNLRIERLPYQTMAEGNGTVPAGTAVMLFSQAVKTAGTAASRTLTFCNENSAAPVTATNLLHGSDVATRTTGEGKHYKLSYNQQGTDIGWYWGAANGAPFQSGAHKAWLVLSGTSAPSFLGLDGETTKIGTTDYTNLKNSDTWFTLDGLKLDKAPTVKGVYIHNGRKQVIK